MATEKIAKITSKGQLTISIDMRQEFGLESYVYFFLSTIAVSGRGGPPFPLCFSDFLISKV